MLAAVMFSRGVSHPFSSPQDLVKPGQVILVGGVAPSRRVLGLVPSLVLLFVARHPVAI